MNKGCIVNDYRNELKERILEYSEKEFYANGVRQVKMDNIANYQRGRLYHMQYGSTST